MAKFLKKRMKNSNLWQIRGQFLIKILLNQNSPPETIFPHTIFLCISVFEMSEELPKDKVGNVTQKANTEEKSDLAESQSDETSGAQNLNSTTGISYA